MTKPNVDRQKTILALWSAGPEWSLGQIAMRLGINRNQVSGVVNRARKRGDVIEIRGSPIGRPGKGGAGKRLDGQKRRSPRYAHVPNEIEAAYRAEMPSEIIAIGAALPYAKRPHHRRPVQEVPMTASLGLTLEQVQDLDGCRWPMSMSLKDTRHSFCGLPRARAHLPFMVDPSAYCCQHDHAGSARATGSIKAAEKYPGWAA